MKCVCITNALLAKLRLRLAGIFEKNDFVQTETLLAKMYIGSTYSYSDSKNLVIYICFYFPSVPLTKQLHYIQPKSAAS